MKQVLISTARRLPNENLLEEMLFSPYSAQLLPVFFKGKKIDAQVTTGGGAGVTKQVKYLIDGEVLFSINSRYTGGTYRNFINTGPLLREILEKA